MMDIEREVYNHYRLNRRRAINRDTQILFGEDRTNDEYPYAVFTRKDSDPPRLVDPVYCKSRGEACEAYFKRLEELEPCKEKAEER